jgi:hypothetical protein
MPEPTTLLDRLKRAPPIAWVAAIIAAAGALAQFLGAMDGVELHIEHLLGRKAKTNPPLSEMTWELFRQNVFYEDDPVRREKLIEDTVGKRIIWSVYVSEVNRDGSGRVTSMTAREVTGVVIQDFAVFVCSQEIASACAGVDKSTKLEVTGTVSDVMLADGRESPPRNVVRVTDARVVLISPIPQIH